MNRQTRHTLIFLASLVILMSGAFALANRQANYLDIPFNFYSMKEDQRLSLMELDRKQKGSIKFGFLETSKPPLVGLFGNHQFQHFSRDAFGPDTPPGYFFNFWYANLGLPEIMHLLDHLAHIDKLPELVLVQITTPDNDNGRHIIDWGGELPDRYVNPSLLWNRGPRAFTDWLLVDFLLGRINTDIDVNKLRSALSQLGGPRGKTALLQRLVSPSLCTEPSNNPYCSEPNGYRDDGSFSVQADHPPLVLNGDLEQRSPVLRPGDENEIARLLESIDRLVEAAGSRAIFIVPPVYETQRGLMADKIFDKALKMAQHITVVDDRGLRDDPNLFVIYDHPSPEYFRLLVQKLQTQNLLPNESR